MPMPMPMTTPMKPWTDLFGDHGPDHFLELVFDHDVRPVVRALDTTGFVRTELRNVSMVAQLRDALFPEAFDLYVDEFTAVDVVANMRGVARKNIWLYRTIMVGADRIWIEHGLGATSPETLAVEARVLERAMALESGLISWSIEYGGDGYPGVVLVSGATPRELVLALEQENQRSTDATSKLLGPD